MIEELCKRTGFDFETLKQKNRKQEYVISRLLVCEEMNKKGYTQTFVAEKFNLTPATLSIGIRLSLARIRETKYPPFLYAIVDNFDNHEQKKAETYAIEKQLICEFFKFFRDYGEKYIGLTIEEFADEFLLRENKS